MPEGLAIGIDLGTTTSLASIGMPDGKPRLLRDPQGHGIIPSVVSILEDGRILVGQRAKDRIVLDPDNTFFSTKRFIGRDMRQNENEWAAAAYPFRIVPGENGVACVQSHGRTYSLVDVGSMILAYLKKIAEQAVGMPVPKAVITVPANFNDVQRSTTWQAGERAGFEVLRILNEPTAAALAYGLDRAHDSERIAVYDFGGGTFDMTILEVRGQVYEVLATAGNTLLGGDDFDRRIFDRMAQAFQEQTGKHPRENQEFHQKLFLAAERIKCQLSDWLVAGFTERGIPIGGSTVDFHFEMSREQFNEACGDLVDMSFDVCEEALKLAGCTLTSIDQIILVGGTTRVPLLRERVTKYFLRPPLDNIQADTVVSLGAAIQAFALAGGPAMWPAPDQMAGGSSTFTGVSEAVEAPTRIVRMDQIDPGLAAADALVAAEAAAAREEEANKTQVRAVREADLLPPPAAPPSKSTKKLHALPQKPKAPPPPPPPPPPDVMKSAAAAAAPPPPAPAPRPAPPSPARPAVPPLPFLTPPVLSRAPAAPVPQPSTEVEALPVLPPPAPRPTLEPPRGMGQPVGLAGMPVDGPPLPDPKVMAVMAQAPELTQEAMASILAGTAAAPRPAPVLLDVTPMTLGIQTVGGNVETIIRRNAQVPVEQSRLFATTSDDQTSVVIRICQGESRRVAENVVLGEMTLPDLPPMPRGNVAVRVTFEINSDGILSATAVDTKTNKAQRVKITLFGGGG